MKRISLKLGLTLGALALAACANDKPATDASSQTTTTSAPTSNDTSEPVTSTTTATTTTTTTAPSATNGSTNANSGSTASTDTSIPQTRAHGNDAHAATWGNDSTPQPGTGGNAAGASQPPATTAPPPPPNSSGAQNAGGVVTPIDQGNNATDLKITQQIRKQVVSDSSLSFTAKNVKIITLNGKVTLRGQVNSDNEKKWIEATADKVVGNSNVDNQITVKQ